MTLLQKMLIENENNSFSIEIIKNHILAIAGSIHLIHESQTKPYFKDQK